MITDPAFYAAAIPAVLLVGLSKGGFAGISILSLPLLALVASPAQGAAIMLPILIVQDAVSVAAYWRKWDARSIKIVLPGALIGLLLGHLFMAQVSRGWLTAALGLMSVVFATRQLLRPDRLGKPPGPVVGVVCGIGAGFASMVANAGQPPFQIYLAPQRLPRDIFVGTGLILFAVVNWIKVPSFIALGQFSAVNMLTSLVLMPIAIAAALLGVILVRRIPAERFYRGIYALLLFLGLHLIWAGVSRLS